MVEDVVKMLALYRAMGYHDDGVDDGSLYLPRWGKVICYNAEGVITSVKKMEVD
jgi:hypothetical protein